MYKPWLRNGHIILISSSKLIHFAIAWLVHGSKAFRSRFESFILRSLLLGGQRCRGLRLPIRLNIFSTDNAELFGDFLLRCIVHSIACDTA